MSLIRQILAPNRSRKKSDGMTVSYVRLRLVKVFLVTEWLTEIQKRGGLGMWKSKRLSGLGH
jgi:hypothetical protein